MMTLALVLAVLLLAFAAFAAFGLPFMLMGTRAFEEFAERRDTQAMAVMLAAACGFLAASVMGGPALISAAPQVQVFAETVLAELRGVFTPDGACPFWDHVAHKFFPMEFDDADRMTGSTDKQFILDLAPRHPIYVELLPEPARAVIGKVHPQGVPAMALLESEGFRPNGLVDIFDAGPTVACGRDNIRTVRDARRLKVELVDTVQAELPALISTDSVAAFRAVRAKADIEGETVRLTAETAAALKVDAGASVRVKS